MMFNRLTGSIARLAPTAALVAALFATPAAATDIERVVSPGGIEAWLVSDDTLPLIAMNFAFDGGAAQDPADKPGVANLLSALLDEGAGDLDSQTFQEALDASSVELSFNAGRDAFYGDLRTLAANQDEAFRLLRLALTEPRFDADPIERMRAQIEAGIRSDERDPDAIAGRVWRELAYPDHPYGRPVDGTLESVAAIERDELVDFHRRTIARDNLTIAVVGAIDADKLASVLDEVFGGLPAEATLNEVAETAPLTDKRETVEMSIPQTIIRLGYPGLKRDDPDFIPAFIANHILGGGQFSSRLYDEVREERGLAYSVFSFLVSYDHSGVFFAGTATRADRAPETLAVIESEIERFATEGITDEELAKAKSYLIGSYPLRFTTSGRIADQLLGIQLENLGIDYMDRRNGLIEDVTVDDIRRVAKRLFDGHHPIVVQVGQPDV